MRWTMLALVVVGGLAPVSAQTPEMARESLFGLPGVEVVVEGVHADAERDGLTKLTIQTDVELRLRQAGVPVLTREERMKTASRALLYVRVEALRREGAYAYCAQVQLQQLVSTKSGRSTVATTWENGHVGAVGATHLRSLLDSVNSDVDEFINDWLATHPKAP